MFLLGLKINENALFFRSYLKASEIKLSNCSIKIYSLSIPK